MVSLLLHLIQLADGSVSIFHGHGLRFIYVSFFGQFIKVRFQWLVSDGRCNSVLVVTYG